MFLGREIESNSIVYHYKLRVRVYAPVRKIPPEELLGQLHQVAAGQNHPQPDRDVLWFGDLKCLDEFQAQGTDRHGREDAEGCRGFALSEEGRELRCRERRGGYGAAVMDRDGWESRRCGCGCGDVRFVRGEERGGTGQNEI